MSDADRQEEELYAKVAAELDGGNREEGLWAKCFAECDGDENKAKALYLKTRVERLLEEGREHKKEVSDRNRQFKSRQGRTRREQQTGKGTSAESQKQHREADFYYVKDGDEEFGPLTKREIQSQAHKFSADALYKQAGTDDWYDLRKLLG